MRLVAGLARALRTLENSAVAVLLGLVCAVTATQVVFRFVLKAPLAWSDELGTFSFVWFALLGGAIGVREGAHIGVDALVRVIPTRHRIRISLGSLVLVQVFLACLIKLGLDLLLRIGDQRSSGLQIQIFWVYLALPLSATLMLLHTLPAMQNLCREARAEAPEGQKG
ncbi:MAG: TRAP transporter small permease [candidate division NC10 bacterium]|nr:TRAP transporter small permease [candidate division NC10 bacterium]